MKTHLKKSYPTYVDELCKFIDQYGEVTVSEHDLGDTFPQNKRPSSIASHIKIAYGLGCWSHEVQDVRYYTFYYEVASNKLIKDPYCGNLQAQRDKDKKRETVQGVFKNLIIAGLVIAVLILSFM